MDSRRDESVLIEAPLRETDELTGLYNRRKLIAELERRFAEFRRYHHPLSLIIFDIDLFKQVNDKYGHLRGDAVLQELTQLCAELIRDHDTLGRFGGEEFALILPNIRATEAATTAERLRKAIAEHSFQHIGSITISLGLTIAREDDDTIENLISRADEALYNAKRNGRNTYCQQL